MTMPSESLHEPGFAKRYSNLTETRETGRGFEPRPVAAYEIHQAIALGLTGLLAQERDLLHFYCAFLNSSAIQDGHTFVWPGAQLTCEALGISGQTLRRHKLALERKGFLIRHYDRRNRPLERCAIDLSPFLAQLDDLLEGVADLFAHRRARWELLQGERMADEQSKISAKALKYEHLNRLNPFPGNSVPAQPTASPTTATAVNRPSRPGREVFKEQRINPNHTDPATEPIETTRHLPTKRQADFPDTVDNTPDLFIETPPELVFQAIDASPTLSRWFENLHPPSLSTAELEQKLHEIVAEELPERNTLTHSWPWAIKRYGWRAVELLAVALDDPQIHDRYKFLGYMATVWKEELVLTPNLKRLRAKRTEREDRRQRRDAIGKLIALHPLYAGLSRHGMKDATLLAWFSQTVVRENVDGGLTLVTHGHFAANHIRQHFAAELATAAGAKVAIVVEKD